MQPDESFVVTFKREVLEGLRSSPKRLSSKYFYDERGDELFQKIMELPEYYLTRCEMEIFETQKSAILKALKFGDQPFDLVEFGAGDGKKTKVLLQHFLSEGVQFTYRPVDISANILNELEDSLHREMPNLEVEGLAMDYFKALDFLKENSSRPKVLLFLGSNVGNYRDELRNELLEGISKHLNPKDHFFIGLDLKKDPNKILAAYNDSQGVTAAFNSNILRRIKKHLSPDLELENFKHFPNYSPITGEARSYLIAQKDMEIDIDGEKIELEAFEPIHTEVSKKFSKSEINHMIDRFGFDKGEQFTDSKDYYVNSLWIKK
jgi:dimethylhistidine N-methyltransferase